MVLPVPSPSRHPPISNPFPILQSETSFRNANCESSDYFTPTHIPLGRASKASHCFKIKLWLLTTVYKVLPWSGLPAPPALSWATLQPQSHSFKLTMLPPPLGFEPTLSSAPRFLFFILCEFVCRGVCLYYTFYFMCCTKLLQSCLTLCDTMDCNPPGSSVHWFPPGKNTGMGCHFLLQGIFPTQGWNPCLLWLLHCRWILYLWATGEALLLYTFL